MRLADIGEKTPFEEEGGHRWVLRRRRRRLDEREGGEVGHPTSKITGGIPSGDLRGSSRGRRTGQWDGWGRGNGVTRTPSSKEKKRKSFIARIHISSRRGNLDRPRYRVARQLKSPVGVDLGEINVYEQASVRYRFWARSPQKCIYVTRSRKWIHEYVTT